MENEITFVTSDKITIKAKGNLKNILKNMITDSKDIVLQDINSEILSYLLEYCYYHNFNDPPKILRSSSMNDLRECLQDEGDFNFIIKVGNYEKVSLLLLAATSLGCAGLEDLCYTYLGFFFRSISLQDLKKDVFKLKNEEFTENEMSNIKQENGSWLMVLTEDRIEELDNK